MKVENDLYEIAARIREIDPAYFIERNDETGKYELHDHRSRPTFVLAFPFGELDARAVEYALKTRAERIEALFAEIEENNLKLEKAAKREAKERAAERLEDALSARRRERGKTR